MDIWSIFLSIIIGAFGIYYLFQHFNFFKRHSVIHIPSIPILGSMSSLIFQLSIIDFIKKIYNFNTDAKYIGMYDMMSPVLLLRDPELIKTVLLKNFQVFPNRRGLGDLNDPLFSKSLFSLQGEKWRNVRNLLSPSFTSSKMKNMFILMSECAADFVKYLSELPVSDSDTNMKDAFTKYTTDVIATCAFGIKVDSMKDPENKFYVYGKELTNLTGLRALRFLFLRTFPKLSNLLRMEIFEKKVSDFFRDSIQTTIATRDAEHITRPDMLQLMMDVRDTEDRRVLDIEEIVAQAFVFFFGGFDPTSTTMCFAAHSLAMNSDVQIKLRQEIDKVLEESGGKVTYETINHLEYLEAVINETLRMYSVIPFLERICETDYELPPALPGEKSFVMKKGMILFIPVVAIHCDEKYYDNPEEFRPERFFNKTYHNSLCYSPFGAGPRMCIGNRFALLEIKVLLFYLLARCELKPCAKTAIPMKLKKGAVIAPENGFWLNIQRRSDMHPALESTMSNVTLTLLITKMDLWSILLSIMIGAFGIYYLFQKFNFFKRHDIIHIPSVPLLGSMAPFIFRQISIIDFMKKMYNFNPDAKYIGMYESTSPALVLRDPELIKTVLVKNFQIFPNRRGFADLNDVLFAKNLFSLQGEKWRNVRNLLSPSFTSSKMKNMFTLMSECAADFVNYLSALPVSDSDINVKDAFTKYTNDVIATCAFGIKIDSIKDPKNKFYVYGKMVTSFTGLRGLRFLFLRTFPKLGNFLRVKIVDKKISDFFMDSIQTTIATRDAEHITRPDMLQLMMDVRDKEGRRVLDIEEMVAQAFQFFFGGFDTSATTMCFAAHLLATNTNVQIKLRQEIDKVLDESRGEVTYETINHLEYLEAVINETLRMYVPVPMLERMCEADYELPPALPGKKPFVIKKGMMLLIPILAMHYDEKYYDNPEEFRPERFLNKTYHNSPYYLPFGAGPRMCIANRFALLEVKVLLFYLLAHCELKPCAKTTLPMKFKKGFVIAPENGFWLNIQRRSDMHPALESILNNGVKS
ncbi:uncharacterized protein LOC109853117 [Pseudomyrmex gracilis]|uniref:uncharacterized protein LOC109853117 n=1 Tax=Pseudomyrmex gracilis TaxID=219809 RepID=UPI000994A9CF|nr:uncharacterized protein LOC109853117 [Pseudomyrmex gracilis]